MRILIRPREGPRELEGVDANSPTYFRKRLEFRRNEMDAMWRRLAAELSLTDEARARAERRHIKLPAVGMMIIDDSIASLERLRSVNWIVAFEERPLPRPLMAVSMEDPLAANPWHLGTINKPAASDGHDVSIGVIDFGCDPAYSDLAGFAPKFKLYDVVAETLNTAPPSDGSGEFHGSKVCSLLAGSTNGVAPKAMYLVAGIAAASYSTTQIGMAIAFEWMFSETTGAHAARPIGVDIITTSLHTNAFGVLDSGDVEALIAEAEGWRTLVVAAVGNGGVNNWQSPGGFPTVVAVGAVDVNRDVAWFSADGKPSAAVDKPDLLAPGFLLEWPTPAGRDLGEGTSFAAPIVAGAAALILQQRPQLRSNIVKFRNAVLSFVSNSTAQGTIRGGRGICDLHGL